MKRRNVYATRIVPPPERPKPERSKPARPKAEHAKPERSQAARPKAEHAKRERSQAARPKAEHAKPEHSQSSRLAVRRDVYATRIVGPPDPLPQRPKQERPKLERPKQERTKQERTQPSHARGRLVRASLIIMLAFIASRVLGLVRELVISYQFGTSRELDAYQAAFRIPDLIFQIVAAGAMGAAFIPVFTGYLARQEDDDAWRMASTVLNVTFLLMTFVAVLAAIFAPQLVPLVAPGFDPDARALTAILMRIMLIQAVLAGVSGLVTAILHSYQDFLLPSLAPVVYNLSIIGGGLLLAPRPEFGVYGLAIGVAVGGALHMLIQIPGLLHNRARYRLLIDPRNTGAREVGRLMLPRIAGLGAIQVNFVTNTILASRLVEGSIAALNYAYQLLMLPWGVFANAISTAIFPRLAAEAALNNRDEIRRVLSLALRMILYLTIPAGVGLLVLREPLIRLLFERGEFTATSTAMTARALMFYAPGLFAIATTEIITRGYYALHDTRTPVAIGVSTIVLNIVLSIILSHFMGHGGLALAYSLANTLEMIVLLALIRGRLGGLEGQQLLTSILRVVVASAIMGEGLSLGIYAAGDLLVTAALLVRLLILAALMAAGALIYLNLTIWLGSDEITSLVRKRSE